MHPEHFERCAAVGAPGPTGDAALAIEIRFDRAAIAGLETVRRAAGVDDLDAELVSEDARVREEGLPPRKRVQVGAAHADPVHTHARIARRLTR